MKSKDLRLLLTFGGSRTLFFGSFFAALINTAIVAGNAFLIASLIVGIIDGTRGVALLILWIALLWAGRAIFLSQFDKWASILASSSKESLRAQVLQSSEILAATPSTHLSTLMIKGGNSLDIYFARFIPQFFSALITPISIIAILFILDPLSAVIAIVTIPLIPVFGALIGRFTQDAVEAKWRSLGTLGKYFEDSLRGIHTLSIFSRLKGQAKRIEEMGDRYTDETMKVLRISFLSALVLELAATISVALIAVSVGLRLVNGSIEFWPSLSILILAPEVYFPLRNAASLFHASADGGAALNEINQLLSAHSEVKDEGGLELTHVEEISWSNWSSPFGAGSLPAHTLKPGDSLIIRGGSGLGKTTFINAILGYGDSRGISINGQEISGYRKRFVSPCIGWIPQNPALISGTLRELFQYLKADIADDEIEFTLSKVGLHLKDLPDGLETTIGGLGEKSGTLSGGQIRRIAIARAIVQSPSIVIADEPTADLDPKSAQEILRLLEDIASSGAIVIAVLHAPDHTLSGADEIAMVER